MSGYEEDNKAIEALRSQIESLRLRSAEPEAERAAERARLDLLEKAVRKSASLIDVFDHRTSCGQGRSGREALLFQLRSRECLTRPFCGISRAQSSCP